ncbi:MAG: chemotaxis protein CheW [Bryobacteraceae bacterium]|nr:chemotaxis protein CheW [Solibacteraceae bacterium]MCL4841442.1 chemotaxis protein CheW [Bryobacteraceae bacterium]MCO5351479.1 chemotaxis protein CheW [Bryobacteraceae bacterium]
MDTLLLPRAASYLVIRLAGREFALDATQVQGMVQARGIDLLSRPGSVHLLGFTIRVVEPHEALRLPAPAVTARSCLVLVGELGAPPRFALLVDSVSRIERIPAHLTRLEPSNHFALAQIRLGEKWRDVLDLEKLASL